MAEFPAPPFSADDWMVKSLLDVFTVACLSCGEPVRQHSVDQLEACTKVAADFWRSQRHRPAQPFESRTEMACEWTLVRCTCGEWITVPDELVHQAESLAMAVTTAFLGHNAAIGRAASARAV